MSQNGTDEVIKRALKEEEQAKKARKAAKAAQGQSLYYFHFRYLAKFPRCIKIFKFNEHP